MSATLWGGFIMAIAGAIALLLAGAYAIYQLWAKKRYKMFAIDWETGDIWPTNTKRGVHGVPWDDKRYPEALLKSLDVADKFNYKGLLGERPCILIDANTGQPVKRDRLQHTDRTEEYYHTMFCRWVNADAVRQHEEAQRGWMAQVLPVLAICAVAITVLVMVPQILKVIL